MLLTRFLTFFCAIIIVVFIASTLHGAVVTEASQYDQQDQQHKQQQNRHKFLLFHIDSDGAISLETTRVVATDLSPCQAEDPLVERDRQAAERRAAAAAAVANQQNKNEQQELPEGVRQPQPNNIIHVSYRTRGKHQNNNNDNKDNDEEYGAGTTTCHVVVRDPRIQYHDAAHPEHGESTFHGGSRKLKSSHFAVVVPLHVTQLRAVDLSPSSSSSASSSSSSAPPPPPRHALPRQPHQIDVPTMSSSSSSSSSSTSSTNSDDHERQQRVAETLATAIDKDKVIPTTLQIVGLTANQRNMVFLPSGYTAGEKTKFDQDVKNLMDFMQLSSTAVSSMPYYRYFSVWNFFSVWHPSEQSGASHPAPAGSGATTDNVLQCSYGENSARILSCDRPRVLVLASYAPPDPTTSLVIVLVNDDTFGGTGGSGICSIYTGDKMNAVFIHEVGHAFADLSDEYSYGTAEAQDLERYNCAWTSVLPPWQAWISAGVLGTPVLVCTYVNYFKPTNGHCLMHSEKHSLCHVCKEITTRHMYGLLGPHKAGGLNLASPRFPSEHDTLVVRANETAVLRVNDRWPTHTDSSGKVRITWRAPDGTTALTTGTTSESFIAVAAVGTNASATGATTVWRHSGPGDYTLYADIEDITSMLLATVRTSLSTNKSSRNSFLQRHPFRVKVIPAANAYAGCTWRSDKKGGTYCGVCQAGYEAECALSVTARPLAAVADVSGDIPGLEGWLIGIGVGFLVIGAIAFYFTYKTMEQHAEENVGEILPLSDDLEYLRIAVMIFAVLQLLAATFVIMYGAYMFMVLSLFGRDMVLGVVISACVAWFFSFVTFTGSFFNNRQVVFASFILNLFMLLLCLLFTGMILRTHANLDQDDVFIQLRDEWRATIKSDPGTACEMQAYLHCSGWHDSCVTQIGATSDCPPRCELANKIGFPCWPKVRAFVSTHYYRAAIGGIVLSVFLFFSAILTVFFGCGMKVNRSRIHRARYRRALDGQTTLSESEFGLLRREFRKIDTDGTGRISRDQFARFYSSTMGVELSADQLTEYFDSLDNEGEGTLSFRDFIQIYMPPPPESDGDDIADEDDLRDAEEYNDAGGFAVIAPVAASQHRGSFSRSNTKRRQRRGSLRSERSDGEFSDKSSVVQTPSAAAGEGANVGPGGVVESGSFVFAAGVAPSRSAMKQRTSPGATGVTGAGAAGLGIIRWENDIDPGSERSEEVSNTLNNSSTDAEEMGSSPTRNMRRRRVSFGDSFAGGNASIGSAGADELPTPAVEAEALAAAMATAAAFNRNRRAAAAGGPREDAPVAAIAPPLSDPRQQQSQDNNNNDNEDDEAQSDEVDDVIDVDLDADENF